MSYSIYKLLHFTGIFLLFMSLGALVMHASSGKPKAENHWRKFTVISHGVAMFLILLGGFGMLAKLGIMSAMPLWVWLKLLIWLLLGGSIAVIYKRSENAKAIWFIILALGVLAAAIVALK